MKFNDQGRVSKEDAKYVEKSKSPAEHRCGICEYVRKCPETGEHYCTRVEGEVKDMAGCKLFSVDLVKAANDPITIATNPPEK
jgi:hypothetical protein